MTNVTIYYPPEKSLEARVLLITLRNIGYRAVWVEDPWTPDIVVEVCGKIIEEDDVYEWLRILGRRYVRERCEG